MHVLFFISGPRDKKRACLVQGSVAVSIDLIHWTMKTTKVCSKRPLYALTLDDTTDATIDSFCSATLWPAHKRVRAFYYNFGPVCWMLAESRIWRKVNRHILPSRRRIWWNIRIRRIFAAAENPPEKIAAAVTPPNLYISIYRCKTFG